MSSGVNFQDFKAYYLLKIGVLSIRKTVCLSVFRSNSVIARRKIFLNYILLLFDVEADLFFNFLLPPLLDESEEEDDKNFIDFKPSTINLITDLGRG